MRKFAVASVLIVAASFSAAESDWPQTVVSIEEMKILTPLHIRVPALRERGEVKGPAILKVHINTDGGVERVTIFETCGSPAHDEAALHAVRNARFAPKVLNGQPQEVTLVLPLHLPKPKYPSRG